MTKDRKKQIISDLIVVVVAIIVFLIINNFVCSFINVEGHSMDNTLHEKDKAISFYYDLDNINRFDIVVIDRDNEKRLIKRVIGLPGETIEYKENKLYINGSFVSEDFLEPNTVTDDLIITLKDNEYYCLGDNRSVSIDSRAHGPFIKNEIKSSHLFIIYPFNKIGFIK